MNAKAEGKCERCGGEGSLPARSEAPHHFSDECPACSGTGRAPQQTAEKGEEPPEGWRDPVGRAMWPHAQERLQDLINSREEALASITIPLELRPSQQRLCELMDICTPYSAISLEVRAELRRALLELYQIRGRTCLT